MSRSQLLPKISENKIFQLLEAHFFSSVELAEEKKKKKVHPILKLMPAKEKQWKQN